MQHQAQLRKSGTVPLSSLIRRHLHPPAIELDHEICADCGTAYAPDAVTQVEDLRAQIRAIRQRLVLDLLAEEA